MKKILEKDEETFSLVAQVSDDSMKLFLDIEPKEGFSGLSRDQILAILAESFPTDDLNLAVIDDIVSNLQEGKACKERRVKKGLEATPGIDGKILFLVKKFTGKAEVSIDQRGYAGWKELNLFDNISRKQVVARVYPARPGEDGIDVFGKPVAYRPGKEAFYELDKTLEIRALDGGEKNYQEVVSLEEGFLRDESGRLKIEESLTIKDDLDFRFGNLDFIGKVTVTGDVLKGFSIKARKGIEIKGSVRGASLISPGGDIIVRGFTYGGENSRIISAKSFETTVAQEINVETNGNIVIHKEAIDCSLRTESSIVMSRGRLVGGEAFAVCGVEAATIGTEAGTRTLIRLCSNVETSSEYSKLLILIKNHQKALELIDLHLGPLANNQSSIGYLSGQQKLNIERLLKKKGEIQQSSLSLMERKRVMLEKAVFSSIVRVNFLKMLHSGSVVEAGNEVFEIKEDINGPGSLDYLPAEGRFEVGELKSLQCSIDNTNE